VKTEFFRTSGQPLTPDQAQVLALTEKVRVLLVDNIPHETDPDRIVSALVSNIASIIDVCYHDPLRAADEVGRALIEHVRIIAALTPEERAEMIKEQS
jgi:hypothetical protein